jgi:hypothetical protein
MASDLLQLLDSLALRPQVYVASPVCYATVKSYLNGLAAGLRHTGIEYTWDDYHAAAQARGWDPRGNIGILRDFMSKGLTDKQIVQELIVVEAAAYASALARANTPV